MFLHELIKHVIRPKRKSSVNDKFGLLPKRQSVAAIFLGLFSAFGSFAQSPDALLPGPKPADVPKEWKPWIGEYGVSSNPATYVVSERDEFIWISERPGDAR